MPVVRRIWRGLVYLWALPNSMVGLSSFAVSGLWGARGAWRDGVLPPSLLAWLSAGDAHVDNRFERRAYALDESAAGAGEPRAGSA